MAFDFDAAVGTPFRMQPGLRRLGAGQNHLTPAAPGSRHQREKLAVLSAFADQALQHASGFNAMPALHALARQATHEHPEQLQWDGHTAQALGVAVDAAGQVEQLATGAFGLGDEVARCLQGLAPPWRLAGLLSLAFAEDFAVVDAAAADGVARLPWMAVALPSHWAPIDKIGKPFTAVHASVADNALLMQAAAGLMRLVTGPERWQRFVWNVTAHPRLNAHPDLVDVERWHGRFAPELAWWRTERQTFIPLPELQQAVFTIHVQVQPLVGALEAAQALRLHAAVASMSQAVLAYRGLTAVRAALLAWLSVQAAQATQTVQAAQAGRAP